jgi:hypothetical protein
MSEMIQTVAKEMLSFHKQVADWQIAQAKEAEKQVANAFEVGRHTLELQRDLAQNLGKVMVDAAAKAPAAKA